MLNTANNHGNGKHEAKAPTNPLLTMGPVYNLLCALAVAIFAWASGAVGSTPFGTLFLITGGVFLGAVYIVSSGIIKSLIYSASEILFSPYGMSDREAAFKVLYDYLLNGVLPVLIITDGAVDPRSKDSPIIKWGLRGPGQLQIDGASAVLIERGGSPIPFTAGSEFIDKSDKIRGFAALQFHELKDQLKNVFTRDNIPLDLTVAVQYRIKQDQEILLKRGRYGPNPRALVRAMLMASDWKKQTETTINGKIRDVVAEYNLNDVHGTYPELDVNDTVESISSSHPIVSPRVPLQQRLCDALNSAVEQWGAEVIKVTIDEIVMSSEVKDTLRRAWASRWKNKIEIQEAKAAARVADIKREATLINAQASAEAHRIRAAASAEAQMEITRRAEAIRQLTGNSVDEKLLTDMIRDAMISVTESTLEKIRRASSKETATQESTREEKDSQSD